MHNTHQAISLRPQLCQAAQPLARSLPNGRHLPVHAPEEEQHHQFAHHGRFKIERGNMRDWKGQGLRKMSGFHLLLMLNILGVAQGLSDCQIMEGWMPDMFDGAGTACCDQSGIRCSGWSFGRIIRM
jgi:hypothetical protein